ncbi:MAG: SBBP repeat-containing protein [Bacteroidetes bacterium]|nr:SBBP repeat-containing protein [Bacteroidota bacterium]
MKQTFIHNNNLKSVFLPLFIMGNIFAGTTSKNDPELKNKAQQCMEQQPVQFLENKGQMINTDNIPVPFVLFKVSGRGMDVYITEKGLTFVFAKTEEEREQETGREHKEKGKNEQEEEKIKTEMAWINMHLKGASIKKENILKEGESEDHFNYFQPHCPEGIYGVKHYKKITIKAVYPGIDWVLYNSDNAGMKYDFIVQPGANPEQIKLVYESENLLNIDRNGNIKIKTPLGTLTENAPYSYMQETGAQVKSNFTKNVIDRHNVEVDFDIAAHDLTSPLVIDPQLVWGTFFGRNPLTGLQSLTVDNSNNLFAGGYTESNNFPLQNTGTYFQTMTGGSRLFISKFGNAGNILWSTIYGGGGLEYLYTFAIDGNNNLFVGGRTSSTALPVQNAGTFFQGTKGGGSYDGFILKFDNVGNRLWATYYGGSGNDEVFSLATDGNNNLFVGGYTNSTNFSVQNAGTFFQAAKSPGGWEDAFILKFTNAGTLLWGTFYGGDYQDRITSLAIDSNNNLFAAGVTGSGNFPVQNAGTFFQGTRAGVQEEGFFLKFDNAGNRLWATYYGGTSVDRITSIAIDGSNNLFAVGIGQPATPVQNAGTFFQSPTGGGAFIYKFDNAGNLLWATSFGGATWQDGYDNLALDQCGNIYVVLNTSVSTMPLLDPGCGYFDGTYSAMSDAFIASFTNAGTLIWSSYIGGPRNDFRTAVAVDKNNNVFMGGEFSGYTSAVGLPLINPGGGAYFENAGNNGDNSYILKFSPVSALTQSQVNSTACAPCNGSATINITCGDAGYNYVWSNGSSTVNSTNSSNTISGLCPGTYTVTATSNCNQSKTASFTITGTACGSITATAIGATICPGTCATVTSNGSSGTGPYTYLWSNGSTMQSINLCPSSNTLYTVTVTDNTGVTATSTALVTVNPSVSVSITPTNINCSGASTGSATAAGGSGTPAYTYSWSNLVSGSSVSGLGAGSYTVTVTDSKGCSSTSTTIIVSPPALTGEFAKGTATCTGCGCKEWLMVNATGGTSPYSYTWPDGYINRYKNQLCPGTYSVNIKDKNGCSVNVNLTTP